MTAELREISSNLSTEELQAIVADSADYEFAQDQVMARNFIGALRALIAAGPLAEIDHAGERVRIDIGALERRLEHARRWLLTESACTRSTLPVQYVPHAGSRSE